MDRRSAGWDRRGMYSDPAFLPAARLAEHLRDGSLTARRVTELYLERSDRLNPALRAYRTVRREAALAEADAADARLRAGDHAPLLGVPIAVKDNLAVAGEVTTHGTSLISEPAREDCEAVSRLRAAGAVILGITNMPELALWGHDTSSPTYGTTRNPHDATRGPGGGYRLGRHGQLPPLLLSDDEAVAVAIGLANAGSAPGLADASASAMAKLERTLPDRLQRRVRAIHASTDVGPANTGTNEPEVPVDPDLLAQLAAAISDRASPLKYA